VSIGKQIELARVVRGLSQEQLADPFAGCRSSRFWRIWGRSI
jgi:hypothetical protein